MKFLLKVIFIPLLIMITPPILFLALTYKDVSIPVDEFSGTQVTLTQMVTDEMDTFLADNDADSVISFGVTQQQANGLLKEVFLGINPKFLDDTATEEERNFVIREQFMGYQGSWVRFEDDRITIESGIHVEQFGYTYKTALILVFKLDVNTDEIILTLEEAKLGHLPLAWLFGVINWGAEKIGGIDINTMVNEQLEGIGTFDLSKREVRINIQDMINSQLENDPQGAALINSLLDFVKENELVDIGFENEEFNAEFAIGKLKDDTTPFMLLEADKVFDAADLESILSAQASSLIFSTLTTTGDPFIDLNEFTLNRMFEYFMRDQVVLDGIIHQTVIFENYQLTAYVPYIEMDNDFIVNIPLKIDDMNNPGNEFRTIIKIDATPEIDGNDLRIVLNELTAGTVTLGQEHITNILTLLGDSSFIVDGAFVIENFDAQMGSIGLSLSGVEVVADSLRLLVSLNDAHLLSEIQTAVNDALEAVANNPDFTPEINDAINDVLGSINDPNADPQAAVEDLINVFDTLNDEQQQVVFDELLTALEGTQLNYEDILNLLP